MIKVIFFLPVVFFNYFVRDGSKCSHGAKKNLYVTEPQGDLSTLFLLHSLNNLELLNKTCYLRKNLSSIDVYCVFYGISLTCTVFDLHRRCVYWLLLFIVFIHSYDFFGGGGFFFLDYFSSVSMLVHKLSPHLCLPVSCIFLLRVVVSLVIVCLCYFTLS